MNKISDSLLELEIVSSDMLFSIYIKIWDTFIYILDIINPSYSSLILTQFIISLIILVLSLFFSICAYKYIKYEKLKRKVEEKEKENKEMDKNIKDLKEKIELYEKMDDANIDHPLLN